MIITKDIKKDLINIDFVKSLCMYIIYKHFHMFDNIIMRDKGMRKICITLAFYIEDGESYINYETDAIKIDLTKMVELSNFERLIKIIQQHLDRISRGEVVPHINIYEFYNKEKVNIPSDFKYDYDLTATEYTSYILPTIKLTNIYKEFIDYVVRDTEDMFINLNI